MLMQLTAILYIYIDNDYSSQMSNAQISVQFHRPYLSHRPHNAVISQLTDSNIQINCKQQLYEFTQYTVNTRNTIQYNSRTNADTLQKDLRQQCALDLGSSLLTLTVVVALTPGTSRSRPGRTPLTRQPPAFLRTGSSVELSSTHRLYKDGHPRYQRVIDA